MVILFRNANKKKILFWQYPNVELINGGRKGCRVTRLQSMYNHMVGWAASFLSPLFSILLVWDRYIWRTTSIQLDNRVQIFHFQGRTPLLLYLQG